MIKYNLEQSPQSTTPDARNGILNVHTLVTDSSINNDPTLHVLRYWTIFSDGKLFPALHT